MGGGLNPQTSPLRTPLLFVYSVYHNSHNASLITCLPVPVPAKCTTDLNIHHVAWNKYLCSFSRNWNWKTRYYWCIMGIVIRRIFWPFVQEFYLDLRKNHQTADSTPITTRQLESLIRLTEVCLSVCRQLSNMAVIYRWSSKDWNIHDYVHCVSKNGIPVIVSNDSQEIQANINNFWYR